MTKVEYNYTYLGKRVYCNQLPAWLAKPINAGICTLKPGMSGKIIGATSAGDKIAVEFDLPIWESRQTQVIYRDSLYTTDGNGRGKPGYCTYFYPIQIQLYEKNPLVKDTLVIDKADNIELLLLRRKRH